MTLSKKALQEALDYIADAQFTNDQRLMDICAAARFVERLLLAMCPGACHELKNPDIEAFCEPCHGTGQLWDEGLVEVVAFALWTKNDHLSHPKTKEQYEASARAVLSALTQEVGRND